MASACSVDTELSWLREAHRQSGFLPEGGIRVRSHSNASPNAIELLEEGRGIYPE